MILDLKDKKKETFPHFHKRKETRRKIKDTSRKKVNDMKILDFGESDSTQATKFRIPKEITENVRKQNDKNSKKFLTDNEYYEHIVKRKKETKHSYMTESSSVVREDDVIDVIYEKDAALGNSLSKIADLPKLLFSHSAGPLQTTLVKPLTNVGHFSDSNHHGIKIINQDLSTICR